MTKTEDALLDTMLALMSRRAPENITVSDICAEAKISRGVFYSYFADKPDLLRWCSALANVKRPRSDTLSRPVS